MPTTSKQKAEDFDKNDSLKEYRSHFYIPSGKTRSEQLYFTGNSLGLQPKSVHTYIQQELEDWKNLGVEGHFHGKNPWFNYHQFFDKITSSNFAQFYDQNIKPYEISISEYNEALKTKILNKIQSNLRFISEDA